MRYFILFSWLALTLVLFPGPGHSAEAEDYFRQGYKAAMSRDWEKAISLYTRAIEVNPDHLEARFQRAATLDIQGRIDEAISDYEATLKLRPNYYLAMEYLAKLCEGKGDYFKAVELYSKALSLAPDSKWRSVINGWISEARKKMQAGRKNETNAMNGKSKTDRSKR
jgi:tetratricopeptide (TPR) repeat protein